MRYLLPLLVAAAVAVVPAGGLAAGGTTLTVSPASVPLGSTFTLSGSGYAVPTAVSFEVTGPRKSGINYFTSAEPLSDPCGCFSESWTAWWGVAGDYQITSWWLDDKGARHKGAVVKFTVT